MRTPIYAAALWLLLPVAAGAQSRQELQLNADMRMLQEQVSRLQLTSNQLAEGLKALNQRMDEQRAVDQKQVADVRVLINNLGTTITTVREKLDDNTVRVSQLMQELPAMRSGLSMVAEQLNTLVSLLQPAVNPIDPNAPPDPAGSPLGSVRIPDSPTRLYKTAMGDYASNRMPLAIEGFTEYIAKYPQAPNAPDAQFWIGMSYFYQGEFKEAVQAFDKVINEYKESPKVPEAYYQQGLSYSNLGQRGQATKIFQLIVKEFPGSASAIMAAQRLTPAR